MGESLGSEGEVPSMEAIGEVGTVTLVANNKWDDRLMRSLLLRKILFLYRKIGEWYFG